MMAVKILFILLMIAVLILFVFIASSAIALLFHLYGEEHPNSVNVPRGKTSTTKDTRIKRTQK